MNPKTELNPKAPWGSLEFLECKIFYPEKFHRQEAAAARTNWELL